MSRRPTIDCLNLNKQLRDARAAMRLARIDLDDYINNRTASTAEFDRVYEAVRITTEEYVRLVKQQIAQKYGSTADASSAQLETFLKP
jgi:hypothetical protein